MGKGGLAVKQRMRWAVLILALLILGAVIVCGLHRNEMPPAGDSWAALGLMLLEKESGLYVLAVTQNSPADRCGVQPWDYLVASAETPLVSLAALEAVLAGEEEDIPLMVKRDGLAVYIRLPAR